MISACTQYETDGSGTLGHMLMIAIFDYQRQFGHEPKLLVIPCWRGPEMPNATFNSATSTWRSTFRGIPFLFSIVNDAIELS